MYLINDPRFLEDFHNLIWTKPDCLKTHARSNNLRKKINLLNETRKTAKIYRKLSLKRAFSSDSFRISQENIKKQISQTKPDLKLLQHEINGPHWKLKHKVKNYNMKNLITLSLKVAEWHHRCKISKIPVWKTLDEVALAHLNRNLCEANLSLLLVLVWRSFAETFIIKTHT